jgi:AcrR family transcriptional regulator
LATNTKRLGRPPNEELRSQRREDILEAASKLFAERGFAGADTQELADRLGIAKGTIYRYFPSKEELFLAAADHSMEKLREAVDAGAAEHTEPFAQMRGALEAYLQFFETQPQVVELLIQERAHFKDRATPTYFQHRERNMGRWRDLIASLIAAGRVREMPVEKIVTVVNDLVYGAMFTNYFTGRKLSHHEQAADILDVVFHGILSDSERSA